MTNQTNLLTDYSRIESAIRFIDENFKEQPSLDEIAGSVHLSKYHFQRLFKRWAGVTPGQFVHYLTIEYAKERLRESQSVLDTALDAGLSGPGRLHDLFVTFEAMTPGEYKSLGESLVIKYGFHSTPFGDCLLAMTTRGICALRFIQSYQERDDLLAEVKQEWPNATFVEAGKDTGRYARRIFATPGDRSRPLRVLLKGTNFQVKVWQALLAIPSGAVLSYQDVAHSIGDESATRAVAGAVAKNPIAYLIPCHRVISKAGETHKYRWGGTRKRAILGWEASRAMAPA